MQPSVGRIVQYASKNGDGIISPAVILRTRATTNLEVIERWKTSEDTLSGKGRPADLVPELPDDFTVDLLVWGLGGDYREYAVPYDSINPQPGDVNAPRTWIWPPRV